MRHACSTVGPHDDQVDGVAAYTVNDDVGGPAFADFGDDWQGGTEVGGHASEPVCGFLDDPFPQPRQFDAERLQMARGQFPLLDHVQHVDRGTEIRGQIDRIPNGG